MNPNIFKNFLKKSRDTLTAFWYYITSTIRIKLIAIISMIVLSSVSILIYISLEIFEENMTNMIVFFHSRSTNIAAERMKTEIQKHIQDTKALIGASRQDRLHSKRYESFVYAAQMSSGSSGILEVDRQVLNRVVLESLELKESEFRKKMTGIRIELPKNEFFIRNLAPVFKKPLWLLSVSEEGKLFISIFKTERIYQMLAGESSDASDSMYISYLVNSEGNLILHPNLDRLIASENMLSSPVVTQMYNGKTRNGLIKYKVRDESYFGSFVRLDRLNMGLVSNIPEKSALEGVEAVRFGSMLISIIIGCAAILFIYFFSDTISKPLGELLKAAVAIKKGEYHHELKAKAHDEVGELTEAFSLMASGLEEREKLKGALGKFVNPEIAEQVLQGQIKLGGEAKEATVLFTDIRSFTAISEKLKPEQVVEFLNEYMTLMVGIIYRLNGVVDKFMGDAIMAIWGAPVSKGNDIEDCLNAVLQMRTSLVIFNGFRKQNKQFPIRFGCGINTGTIVSGQIGSPDRLEYTVIGDAVNLASRVEALSKPFAVDIVITDNTYQLVKDIFSVVAMHKVKVKGKEKAQKVYALLGRKDDPKAPKDLDELRKLVGITSQPKIKEIEEEKKYEIV